MLLILFIVAIFIIVFAVETDWGRDMDYAVGTWVVGVILVITVATMLFSRANFHAQIQKFEARRTTYTEQRQLDMTEYERVMLTTSIVEDNSWLATFQAHKDLLWINWFIPKEIKDVKPIK